MIRHHERAVLHDIECQIRRESPELIRLFDNARGQQQEVPGKRARTRGLIAAAAFTGLAILGPRMLDEAEIQTQKRPPLPRTSPQTTAADGPVPVPVTVSAAYTIGDPRTWSRSLARPDFSTR